MRKVRGFVAGGVVCVGLLAAVGSSGEEKAKKVGSEADSSANGDAPPGPATVFKVGDTVELGDLQVIVHGVQDPFPTTNEFLTPAAGARWVAVDTEVKNLSDQPVALSSLVQFEVQDATNAAYNVTITGETLPAIDGEAAPNGSRRGTMVFEVPAAAAGLKLNFKGDLFASGSASVSLG